MECLSYCIGNSIDLTRLDHFYKSSSPKVRSVKLRDILKLNQEGQDGTVYVFKNGTIVSWGVKRYRMEAYLAQIRDFADKLINFSVHDEFTYQIGDKTAIEPHDFFEVDRVTIEEDTDDLKISFSYGFSQSVKLQYFETILESLIEKYTPLIHRLSIQGDMSISRKQIKQVIGEILSAKSEMNLISNFLYHPKYFWQHPTLEEYYIKLERYLHMQRRINAINHRLDTLNDIFEMFNDYLENRHAHRLEIIIIVLIVIEILFGVLNFHF